MSFSCVKIKRASLERDFYTALFVYNGINLHTVRHKSVLHNISQSQSHHPATRQPSLPRLVQTYLINRGHHALHQPHSECNAAGEHLSGGWLLGEEEVSRTVCCGI